MSWLRCQTSKQEVRSMSEQTLKQLQEALLLASSGIIKIISCTSGKLPDGSNVIVWETLSQKSKSKSETYFVGFKPASAEWRCTCPNFQKLGYSYTCEHILLAQIQYQQRIDVDEWSIIVSAQWVTLRQGASPERKKHMNENEEFQIIVSSKESGVPNEYVVTRKKSGDYSCSCPDFLKNSHRPRYACKHIVFVVITGGAIESNTWDCLKKNDQTDPSGWKKRSNRPALTNEKKIGCQSDSQFLYAYQTPLGSRFL